MRPVEAQTSEDDRFPDEARGWIDAIVKHTRSSISAVAADNGLDPATLQRFMKGETRMLRFHSLQKLASRSPIPLPPSVQRLLDTSPSGRREQDVNVHANFSYDSIPIWGVIPFERDGEFKLNPIPVSEISRSVFPSKSLKLAAFYAPDDTMSPRWRAGEPVLFDLSRPAARGDFALIRLSAQRDPNDTETYLFRLLGSRSGDNLELFTLEDEHKPVMIPRTRVQIVHHVLTWSELIG